MKLNRFISRAVITFLFIIISSLSACNLYKLMSAEETLEDKSPLDADQSLLNIPGGLILVPDGNGQAHPAALYDFQIQSQLVSYPEYLKCVDAGACEPIGGSEDNSFPAGATWYQAQAYCEYLGGRLPTEAELRKAHPSPDDNCPVEGFQQISPTGFGEWVYDWDRPDFYNRSLFTNPFGPLYGDLKVVIGLNLVKLQNEGKLIPKLESLSHTKFEYKIEDVVFKSRDVEFKVSSSEEGFVIVSDAGEIKVESWDGVAKPVPANDEVGAVEKFFLQLGDQIFGKFFQPTEDKTGAIGKFFNSPEENAGFFPRLGLLPDQSSPLVGFRCVTQGMPLAYAPISKQTYAAYCSPPDGQMVLLNGSSSDPPKEPNVNLPGISCPENDRVIITLEHDLPSGKGFEINSSYGACICEERADLPGKLFCSCSSPGAGNTLNIRVCTPGTQTLASTDVFCPDGYTYDASTGQCIQDPSTTPQLLMWDPQAGADNSPLCPSMEGLPMPDGLVGLSPAAIEGVDGESLDPELDPWSIFMVSDGSGWCTPGYYFNPATSSCLPFFGDNYGCADGQYFDSGAARCIEVDEDGFLEDPSFTPLSGGASDDDSSFGGIRSSADPDTMPRDEYGRPEPGTNGCGPAAYFDTKYNLCIETQDGCAVGEFLDPVQGICTPYSGFGGPCPYGDTYHPDLGCCLPSPGNGGSECPEGTTDTEQGCGPGTDGCPPSHYYDPASDSCKPRSGGDCPDGTAADIFGNCIPFENKTCPSGYDFDPSTGACMKPYPANPTCSENKYFDAKLGYCIPLSEDGTREGYFPVDVEEGRIASITRVSPDPLDRTDPPSPPEDLCPLYYFMNEDAVCQSATQSSCTSFQITVPFCAAPTREPGSGCQNPSQYTSQLSCINANCKWESFSSSVGGYCTYP